MKSLIVSICILGMVGMVTGVAVLAVDESVTATVTAQKIALSVTPGTVAYGSLGTGQSNDTCTTEETQTITNTGNVNEDFDLTGTVSITAGWTLAAAAGDEIYVHEWSIDGTCTSLTALTMSPQQIATGIIPTTGTEDFDLTVTVPTITTATDAQNVNVTVTASATP